MPEPVNGLNAVAKAPERVVLVVDDEPAVRELINVVLASHGFRVCVARDGTEALRIFKELGRALSMVVIDLQLPGMSELEVVRAIRDQDQGLPVVVASGRLDDRLLVELKQVEVTAFLSKPFTVAQLLQTVTDVSRHAEASRQAG